MASYFKEAIDPSQRKKTIIDCEKLLSGIKFDTIVCRGVSGMALGFVLAHLLDKNISEHDRVCEFVKTYYAEVLKSQRIKAPDKDESSED